MSNHKEMKTKQNKTKKPNKQKKKNNAEKAPKNDSKKWGQWQVQGRYEEMFILALGSSAVKLPAAGCGGCLCSAQSLQTGISGRRVSLLSRLLLLLLYFITT